MFAPVLLRPCCFSSSAAVAPIRGARLAHSHALGTVRAPATREALSLPRKTEVSRLGDLKIGAINPRTAPEIASLGVYWEMLC